MSKIIVGNKSIRNVEHILQAKIMGNLGKLADDFIDINDTQSLRVIRMHLQRFFNLAQNVHVGLHKGTTQNGYTKQTDFINRGGDVSSGTGFRVFLDGRVIGKTIYENGKAIRDLGVGEIDSSQIGKKAKQKRAYVYYPTTVHRRLAHNLALQIFIDMKHGQFVNNENGRKVRSLYYVKKQRRLGNQRIKVGSYWQGTGWAQVYIATITYYWEKCIRDISKDVKKILHTPFTQKRMLKMTEEYSSTTKDTSFDLSIPIYLVNSKTGEMYEAFRSSYQIDYKSEILSNLSKEQIKKIDEMDAKKSIEQQISEEFQSEQERYNSAIRYNATHSFEDNDAEAGSGDNRHKAAIMKIDYTSLMNKRGNSVIQGLTEIYKQTKSEALKNILTEYTKHSDITLMEFLKLPH